MKRYLTLIILIILTIIITTIITKSCSGGYSIPNEVIKTDTLYLEKYYKKDTIIKQTPPEKVIVYKTDTLLRKEVENDTIILNISKTQRFLSVTKIDTSGRVFQNYYKTPFLSTYRIDNEGRVKIKKYRLLKICIGVAVGIGAGLIIKNNIKKK